LETFPLPAHNNVCPTGVGAKVVNIGEHVGVRFPETFCHRGPVQICSIVIDEKSVRRSPSRPACAISLRKGLQALVQGVYQSKRTRLGGDHIRKGNCKDEKDDRRSRYAPA
jgi:hypothetical protein